eukprot:scaffold16678_cov17-Tisochrysis_lutea.AAC.2
MDIGPMIIFSAGYNLQLLEAHLSKLDSGEALACYLGDISCMHAAGPGLRRKEKEKHLGSKNKRRHIGSKSPASPSPEGQREAGVGL